MSEEIRVQLHVTLEGRELAKAVTRAQQQFRRSNLVQRRGPTVTAEQRIFEKWYSRAFLGSKLKFWKGLH